MSKLTQKAIEEAFLELLREKPLDAITVKDIIETADINRNTFYYHYRDIYDLLECIFRERFEQYQSGLNTENGFYAEYTRLLAFLESRSDAIHHLYESKSRKVLQHYVQSAVDSFVCAFVDEAARGTSLSPNGKTYITCFYACAIIGVTLRQIEAGTLDNRDGMMRTISDSFEKTVSDMIKIYIEGHPEECR